MFKNPEKLILISEPNVDYIYYFKAFENSTKILYSEYNENMTVNDIIENAPEFDYVVINDCSRDDTYKLCLENGVFQ